MNKPLFNSLVSLMLMISVGVSFAQTPDRFRFEAEAGVATLNLPKPYRTGSLYHQQLTGYFSPHWGMALGLHWGSSANRSPLKTIYANQSTTSGGPPQLPDPVALRSFYQRSEQMTNLTFVFRPVLSRRHQVKVQAGLSAYSRREFGVDSVRYIGTDRSYFETVGQYTDKRRVVPMAAIGYDVQLSSRWAVGLSATAYFTGDRQPTTALGLRGTYRFNVLADSLGINTIDTDGLHVGVRAGTTLTSTTGNSPDQVYRARFVGGVWAELPVSLTWALRGEVNYNQRGYRIRGAQTNGSTYRSGFGNLNYLDLPLFVRYEAAYKWHVYGGPYIAFYLNGYTQTAEKRNPAIKPHTVGGLAFGTSYDLTKKLALDARYSQDLLFLSNSQESNLRGFQVGMTWAFH